MRILWSIAKWQENSNHGHWVQPYSIDTLNAHSSPRTTCTGYRGTNRSQGSETWIYLTKVGSECGVRI